MLFNIVATLAACSRLRLLHPLIRRPLTSRPNPRVTVTRGGKTLPISQVPNLVSGDRLWIKADLPRRSPRIT